MPRILIVEDDPRIIEAIERTFTLARSYDLHVVSRPEEALPAAIELKPDLILLDIRLPGGDGRLILKRLKENAATQAAPVIFLTGLASEGDRVLGLNLGADDYVVKPFGALELLARIEAVLRRTRPQAPGRGALAVGPLRVDADRRQAFVRGRPLRLRPREFELLCLLASRAGRPLARSFLIENTSSYGMPVSSRSLDTHIKNIRRKLGPDGRLIETLPKFGYRLAAP